ncbi:hypothetical protein B0O99DRAFT_601603 [Bisporella sp. PMI_857]|nr:hypothetical protein B0O99DRAFT_601603 [Bisporella sp. PMI_857]
MAAHNSKIIFHTNSPEYLHKLIPKKYHTNSESTEPECTFILRDRSLLQANSIHQKVVFDVTFSINSLGFGLSLYQHYLEHLSLISTWNSFLERCCQQLRPLLAILVISSIISLMLPITLAIFHLKR